MANLTGWHFVILLGVVVLLFGAKKLPDAARSVGQAARVLKGELNGLHTEDAQNGQPSTPRPGEHTVGQPLDTTHRTEPTQLQPPPVSQHQRQPQPEAPATVENQPRPGTTSG
jgi:sec-independent protein translocase protein TatA